MKAGLLPVGSILMIVLAQFALAAGSPADDGQHLFEKKCAICHAVGGTGTTMLSWRLGKERSILAERIDLQSDYVKAIVRSGLRSMPPLTRVEVTDIQLAAIASYLTRANPANSKPPTL